MYVTNKMTFCCRRGEASPRKRSSRSDTVLSTAFVLLICLCSQRYILLTCSDWCDDVARAFICVYETVGVSIYVMFSISVQHLYVHLSS